jgi:UDP-N-acetyl-D-mannosaminuronic acid dehydrogenase
MTTLERSKQSQQAEGTTHEISSTFPVPATTVQIFGLGYIGLPTAAVMARAGIHVHGVDISQRAVDAINAGQIHIHEDGLLEVVKTSVEAGLLQASTAPSQANVHIIAVPTPINPDKSPDLSYVESASRSIATVLRRGDLVILESTVPPRTCLDVVGPILKELTGLAHETDYDLVHCPERVIPGRILHELVHNDRIIGGTTIRATQRAKQLYASFVQGELLETDATTAETCKLMENTFRDVNIALANEFAAISERIGINVQEAIKMANHHPRVNIHQPGIGVGGHCIPVDPWFIIHSAPDVSPLLRQARQINDAKPHQVAARLIDATQKWGGPLALLGLAYKANVDDFRESPAMEVALEVARHHREQVLIVEPFASNLPTELAEYTHLKLVSLEEALEQAKIVAILVEHSAYHVVKDSNRLLILTSRNNFLRQD